jgi:hypothetical protein
MQSIWHWFFYVLLPLVVLLLLAVWRRTSEYGMTERRYFVIVLGLWLAAVALYFIFSRVKNIKIIPQSLCIIALVASFGPWGAFSISERNQVNRLEEVLAKNDILIDGKVHKTQKDVPFDDAKRVSSVLRYLAEVHGFASIQPWFEEKLDTLVNSTYTNSYYRQQESTREIVKILGVRYVAEWETSESDQKNATYSFTVMPPFVLETKQYRYLISNIHLNSYADTESVQLGRQRWDIILKPDSDAIIFVPPYKTSPEFSVDLRNFSSVLLKQYGTREYVSNPVPQDSMILTAARNDIRLMLFFETLQITADSSGARPTMVSMSILMSTEAR